MSSKVSSGIARGTTIAKTEASTVKTSLGVQDVRIGPSLFEQTDQQVGYYGGNYRRAMTGSTAEVTPLIRESRNQGAYWYAKARTMRKHPTVKLVRCLSIAAMSAAKWSITTTDKAPEGAKGLISQSYLPKQHQFMSTSLRGNFDFGWQPYEQVVYFDMEENKLKLRKLKPLLQDITNIIVRSKTGEFYGFKQANIALSQANSLLINQDVEGTYWYGESTMSAIELAYDRWLITDQSNVRYDNKISGSHWVIYYPVGKSMVRGLQKDNIDIALEMLMTIEGSGSVAIPSNIQRMTTDLNNVAGNEAWRIDMLNADSSQQMGFGTRLSYLDSLMVRGGEFPERAILEGQYGTKAEAEAHADFAVARMDWRNKNVEEQLNEQSVDRLLIMNWGQKAKGTVKVTISPIADDKKTFLKNIYQQILTNPITSSNELSQIDVQSIRDQLEVPAIEGAGNNENQLQNMLANLNNPDDPNQDPNVEPTQPPQIQDEDDDPQQPPNANPFASRRGSVRS